MIGRPEECIEKVAMLSERFGLTQIAFEVNYGALPHAEVMRSMQRFARQVVARLR